MFRVRRYWEPWEGLEGLRQEMNRLLAGYGREAPERLSEFPPINVWQSDDAVALTAELPGLDAEHLDVTVTAGTVSISGELPAEELKEGETYHRKERPTEPFSRIVELPFEVDPQHAEANYENGVLILKLYRPEEQKPKKVVVKSG